MNFNCSNDGPFASFKRKRHSPFFGKKSCLLSGSGLCKRLLGTVGGGPKWLRLLTPPLHTRQDETAIWTFQFMMFMILLQHGKLLGVLQAWLNPAKKMQEIAQRSDATKTWLWFLDGLKFNCRTSSAKFDKIWPRNCGRSRTRATLSWPTWRSFRISWC